MSDELKKFVIKHKQEFDTKEPPIKVWEKIDKQLEVKTTSRGSSNWLSKYKYLAFLSSLLVVSMFFLFRNSTNTTSENSMSQTKDSNLNQHKTKISSQKRDNENSIHGITVNKNSHHDNIKHSSIHTSSKNIEPHKQSTSRVLANGKIDSVSNLKSAESINSFEEKNKQENSEGLPPTKTDNLSNQLANEKKVNLENAISKKTNLYIPIEPEKVNSYTGTLYEGISFCSMLQAYKFVGKVRLNDVGYSTMVQTISCSRIAKLPNIKAIWLKGRTDKEIILSVKRKFKNIVLVKQDGSEFHPEAISHYYKGLGAISEYRGRYFEMLFTDNVELILFFKNAEEGDKIIIDGTIEALVKNQP